jgi:hypothetical protein
MALRREKQVECPGWTQIALRQGLLKHDKGYSGAGFPQMPAKSTAQTMENFRENNSDVLDGIRKVDILS